MTTYPSYASVCRSSLNVNQSLQFAFIRLEILDSVSYTTLLFATFRTSSQTIAMIRHGIVLDHLICKLAGHNLNNLRHQTLVDERNANA